MNFFISFSLLNGELVVHLVGCTTMSVASGGNVSGTGIFSYSPFGLNFSPNIADVLDLLVVLKRAKLNQYLWKFQIAPMLRAVNQQRNKLELLIK